MFTGMFTKDNQKVIALRNKVSSLLREDYNELHRFFKSLSDSEEYDYIVLMSRRCLVLYQLYMLMSEDLTDSDRVISNQAIPYYREALKGKRVTIVDDILIHGRTVSDVYRLLEQYCGEAYHPDIWVYMANTEINCVDQHIQGRIKSFCVAYTGEWRNLSNRIISAIISSNIPYTSFVESFFYHVQPAFLEQIQGIEAVSLIENTDFIQEQCGVKAFYCYEMNSERKSIFRSLSLKECIRIYKSEDEPGFVMIPYVFTKAFPIQNVQEMFESLKECVPESMISVRNILCSKSTDDKDDARLIEYKMRLVTCILSNLYLCEFTGKYHLFPKKNVDVDTLAKSFGRKVAQEINLLFEENIDALLEFKYDADDIDVADIDSDLKETLKNALGSNDGKKYMERNILKNYFQKAWYEDERRAEQSEERFCGLPLEVFVSAAQETQIAEEDMFRHLISSWDIGIAAANYRINPEKKYVGCFNSPGEQSYKIILEKYPYIMYSLIFVSKSIKYDGKKQKKDFENERVRLLLDLLKKFDDKYTLEDYSEIEKIIKRDRGYLGSWNQSAIIQNALRYDTIGDDSVVLDFIGENL